MQQTALFHEDIYDALAEAVRHLGGVKKVGHNMRPELSPDAAGNWLKDCINSTRREKLAPEQMLWILREARLVGFHGAMNFIAGDCGYANPNPIEPADEMAELQRNFIESVQQQKALAERIERLTQSPLRVAK